jgi:hypothetical protein
VKRQFIALILTVLTLALVACSSPPPPEVAPEFSLPDSNGQQVALNELLQDNEVLVLVFYRGFF